jgi:glycosyltransferase involved in cell wall biosynthesis
LKLLIGASSSKIFHLKEFAQNLEKNNIECKVVLDSDYADGFPSRKIGNWFKSNSKFTELINDFKPDAVFVDRQRHFGLEALKNEIPLFVHLRGNYWEEMKMARKTLYSSPPKKLAINKWDDIASQVFQGSKIILPICKHLENVVKNHYPKKPTSVLYQGITPENWFRTEGMKLKHPCVGLLQSAVILEKTKELLTLTKVLEKMPDVTFYWAGDGPYRDDVLPILEKFDNFQWLGALEYPDKVRDFLTEIDVYALLSGIDMSPLTLLEAQLMEKPVVATNVGGIPELMKDGETGFLVTKNNPEELAEKISILVNDNKKSESMSKKGKDFVSTNFNWDKICHDFLDCLKNMI